MIEILFDYQVEVDGNILDPKYYQVGEFIHGKHTLYTTKLMVTMGIKEVFRHLEHDETELLNF